MPKAFLALTALLLLAGCVVAGPVPVGVVAGGPGYDYYDAYYDGYYGPFVDGYWGNDGAFWYGTSRTGFRRDDGHHFQHAGVNGFNHVHGSGMHREH